METKLIKTALGLRNGGPFKMRTEASNNRLMETIIIGTTRIQALEPWNFLWDLDIIGIRVGDEPENTWYPAGHIGERAESLMELRFMRGLRGI